MANVIVDKTKLDYLANAISAKSGEPLTLTLDEMVEAVDGIETGGGGITPTGNINITSAGTTDVTNYATATVPLADTDGGVDETNGIFYTQNGVRKWKIGAIAYTETAGWIEAGGTSPNYQSYSALASGTSVTPTESSQTIGGTRYMMEGAVTVNAIPSNYVGSGVARKDSTDLAASGATVTAPAGYYASAASKSVASGSATPPTTISGSQATLTTGTNTITLQKTLSVTPQVSAGYVSAGTAGNVLVNLNANVTTKAATTFHPSSSQQTIASGTYLTGTQTINAVTTTNLTADNIKNGVVVQVGDSSDPDSVTSITGTYSGGGGADWEVDTKTITASNYPVSIQFTSMKGQPKAFFLRSTSQISSSGSTTYYYIIDVRYNGTNTTGNCFRIGSTRRVENITSGYSWSYSGTTLTITSSASSRSASPGAFNNGYELTYFY